MDYSPLAAPESVQLKPDKIAELNRIVDAQIAEGLSPGMQVVIARHGQPVVDRAVGLARRAPPVPVDPHTLFFSWSVAKPIAALAAHLLVERGQIGLDDPIARAWPGFGKHGKDRVTVRHVLTHRAGFPGDARGQDPGGVADWDAVIRGVEELPLEWEPGTAVQYHALTFGWVLGELVRRVDGRPIEVFARDEFFIPLGMRDSYLKLTEAELARTVELTSPDDFADGVTASALFNIPAMRCVVVPAASMNTTARDLGRFYQMLLNGGELDGVRVLQAETVACARASSCLPDECERDNGLPAHRAHGFELGGYAGCIWGKSRPTTFGHNGFGSNASWADPETGLVCVILNNGVLPEQKNDERLRQICETLWAALSEEPGEPAADAAVAALAAG